MREQEYAALLANGFKNITEADLEKEFVRPFSNSAKTCRNNLLIDFGRFLNEFKTLNIRAEIWIDGSFVTLAPDPADIDVVFYFDPNELEALSVEQKRLFERLFQNRKFIKNLYKVEVFQSILGDEMEYRKWQQTFGTGYDNKTPKGIFKLNIVRP